MKLSRLFVIAMLVGTVGVFGCSDDENGTGGTGGNGTGGTGGNGTGGTGGGSIDVGCDEGRCLDAAVATECEEAIAACILAEPANEEECIASGNLAYCDESGAGGTGGGGGTGVPPGSTEWCEVGLCADAGEARTKCEEILDLCVEFVLEAQWDECAGAARLLACGELA